MDVYWQALLRVLLEYTSDDTEKRRLQELCSKQGNDDYARYIREPSLSVIDILNHFSSCHPPVERLIGKLDNLCEENVLHSWITF